MIIEALLNLVKGLLTAIVNLIPTIPVLPQQLIDSLAAFFELLKSGLGIFYFFVRPSTAAICIPLFIVILEFEHIVKVLMWIVKKIPFINIH